MLRSICNLAGTEYLRLVFVQTHPTRVWLVAIIGPIGLLALDYFSSRAGALIGVVARSQLAIVGLAQLLRSVIVRLRRVGAAVMLAGIWTEAAACARPLRFLDGRFFQWPIGFLRHADGHASLEPHGPGC